MSSVLASCGLLAHVAVGKWEAAIGARKQARGTPREWEIQKETNLLRMRISIC